MDYLIVETQFPHAILDEGVCHMYNMMSESVGHYWPSEFPVFPFITRIMSKFPRVSTNALESTGIEERILSVFPTLSILPPGTLY